MTGPQAAHLAAACRDAVKTYRTATESVTALDGVSLSVARARVTVVVGPLGSGKSSLDTWARGHTWGVTAAARRGARGVEAAIVRAAAYGRISDVRQGL